MSLVLRNARVAGDVVDVRIDDGLISELGTVTDSGHESVDLGGRWLSPGLWDNHVHFGQWALHSRRVDLSAATSAAESALLLATALATAAIAPGETVVGVGFRDGLWPDAPNLADLDGVAPHHPVALLSGDLHSAWLNSAALALYGFAGHPTGLLREDDAFRVQGLINTVPDATSDLFSADAARAAAARGVVGIVDMEMAWNLESWARRTAAGADGLRVEFAVYPQHLDRAIGTGLRGGAAISELVRVGPFKVITDGSLNTRTAYCYDPYPGLSGEHSHGMLTVAPDALLDLMRRAAAADFAPAVHAIGDHANTLALDAFEAIGCRGTIEHAQLLRPADIPRFAALGVVASVQPEHALDDRDVADRYWASRTDCAFVLRTLLDAGATLAFGSDAPVAPLDPWVTIAAAVGRTRGEREPWHPEQRITAAEALAASTRTRVAVGETADLVVTDADPLTATPVELRTMPVSATILAGRFTHDAL